MNAKEYHADPAIGHTILADFYDSPDVALMEREAKSYFEIGKAFELMVQDRSHGTMLFDEKYFVADLSCSMPDELPEWLERGVDLTKIYVYKKDGTLNNTYKSKHLWLDVCIDNPGKIPISKDQFEMLEKMVENLFKIVLFDKPIIEYLKSAKFQAPFFWENGIKKKALVDCIVPIQENGITTIYVFDIKTSADFPHFKKMFNLNYWLQDKHYIEGVEKCYKEHVKSGKVEIFPQMIFLTASKKEPFLAQPFVMDAEFSLRADDVYADICENFAYWDANGRLPRGWKDLEYLKLYLK